MSNSKRIIAILGASGYGGGELLRFLLAHPHAEVAYCGSRGNAGKPVTTLYPQLRGYTDLRFEDKSLGEVAKLADVVFSGLPHGETAGVLHALLSANPDARVIDLSGDFRLDDAAEYKRYYKTEHPHPEMLGTFVYGMPEFRRDEIAGATRIANPGCFASCVQYALTPLMRSELEIAAVSVFAATGSSGSGAAPKDGTHHPARDGSFYAYKPLDHQHIPEINRQWRSYRESVPQWSFIPHSAPLVRGIYVTVVVTLASDASETDVVRAFESSYENAAFVRATTDLVPNLRLVRGSNFVDVYYKLEGRTLVVIAALDNLVKGMAGNAIQNMNLMLGFDQTFGLRIPTPLV
ncbi:MAG: N-acetyl-gamma-glutamyl-phosphate reductase [Planctomycetes bacterium]|nr:N-acetyl-gamma-glutamyl-phosphate reductase [Planctomycetota bacterium]